MSVNPRWFHFFKEQVVPQAASIGSSWPRRKGLAEVVQGLGTYRYAYIYDRQFGTFIGAVGQSDPAVHATILGLAGHENPSQRVFAAVRPRHRLARPGGYAAADPLARRQRSERDSPLRGAHCGWGSCSKLVASKRLPLGYAFLPVASGGSKSMVTTNWPDRDHLDSSREFEVR